MKLLPLFRLRDYHPLGCAFPGDFDYQSRSSIHTTSPSVLPQTDSACPVSFSLSANREIIIYFLFLPVLRCFNSQRSSTNLKDLCIQKSSDQSLHATPRSLSQLATSFVKTQTKLSVYQYK
jgi:hypothetical protein